MTKRFNIHSYYVDEAGDMTLFGKRGRIIVGNEGVSTVFMVGVAYLPQPELAREYLDGLRKELLADPYFKGVPSMQPEARKTATCFHACKDLPEIRYHVFKDRVVETRASPPWLRLSPSWLSPPIPLKRTIHGPTFW